MKKTFIYLALASIAALLTLNACGGDKDSVSITNKPTDDFNAGSHEVLLKINASGAWTISADKTFVTFAPASGNNNGETTMKIAVNESSAARTATVTVTSGEKTDSFTLTQTVSNIQVAGFPDDVLSYQNQSVEFTVSVPDAWTVSSEADWVSFDTSGGNGTAAVKMTVTANNGDARRETTVVIDANGEERSLPLIQERHYFIDDLTGKWYAFTLLDQYVNSEWKQYYNTWEIDIERVPGTTNQIKIYNFMFHGGEWADGTVYEDSHVATIDNNNRTIHIPVYEAEYNKYEGATKTIWAYMTSTTFCDNIENGYTGPISAESMEFENEIYRNDTDSNGNPIQYPLSWISLALDGSECLGSGMYFYETIWQREPIDLKAPANRTKANFKELFKQTNLQAVPSLALRK